MQFQKWHKINFCTRKSLKVPKILGIFQSENCIFGSFKLFSGAEIDFLPFLKLHFFPILEHYVPLGGCPFRQKADISSSVLEVEVSSGKSSLVFDPAPVNSASI